MIMRAQPQAEACSEKERLVDDYGAAVNEYGRTVNMLKHKMGVLLKDEYGEIRNFVEVARIRCEAAHQALEQHVREHGC